MLDLNQVIQERQPARPAHAAQRCEFRGQTRLRPGDGEDRPTRANQALLNVCVNAQDAMPNGGTLTLANTVVLIGAGSWPPGKTWMRTGIMSAAR